MGGLPDTSRGRRGAPPAFTAVFLILAVVPVAAAFSLLSGGDAGSVPEEEVYAAGVEDIAASTADAPYPRADVSRFEPGTREVRVYLRLRDAPASDGVLAVVRRSGRSSAFSRIFGGAEVRAEDAGDGRLAVSGAGASGVVSFVVRAADGGVLPVGQYAVEVRFAAGEEGSEGRPAARKYFAIGDPQT